MLLIHWSLVKLHFCSYIAGLLEPFLKLYQTDNPMITFLFLDIKAILSTLLAIVVKPDVLEKCNTALKMIEMPWNLRTWCRNWNSKAVANRLMQWERCWKRKKRGSKVYFCISFENNRKMSSKNSYSSNCICIWPIPNAV